MVCMYLSGTGAVGSADGLGQACGTDADCRGYYRCRSAVCVVPPAVQGRADEGTPVAELASGGVSRGRFFIELASDWPQRIRGLSHRPSMAEGWGMLFLFPNDVRHAFTMKQMHFPLDLIFIDGVGKVVDIVSDARPNQVRLAPTQSYRYVLELNAGTARTHGIRLGDRLTLTSLPDVQQPAGLHPRPEP
jgi:uncharacterized membrane protein (UPF0127 family)